MDQPFLNPECGASPSLRFVCDGNTKEARGQTPPRHEPIAAITIAPLFGKLSLTISPIRVCPICDAPDRRKMVHA